MNDISAFVQRVFGHYNDHGRSLPWRQADRQGNYDPYVILVSEIMLQQTQVNRVIPKYDAFLQAFPTVESLAQASLGDVLRLWSGLGYNRRAKFLWQAAQEIAKTHQGIFPTEQKILTTLPGVGVNTAGAVLAYAFNEPVIFIETNIRTVFIHDFFTHQESVHDKELVPYIQAAIQEVVDRGDSPREWYWALMDYGTHLKTQVGNVSRSSKHYTKQSSFAGSRRQVRGQVLKALAQGAATYNELSQDINDDRLQDVLNDLVQEGLINSSPKGYWLD